MFVAATCTNGPAGRSSATFCPPIDSVVETAAVPVLIPIAKPPPKLAPGSVSASVPEIDAATPPEVICSAPCRS